MAAHPGLAVIVDAHAKLATNRISDNKVIESRMLISLLSHSPVTAHPRDYPDGAHQPRHVHAEAQLLYAVSGVMRLITDSGAWVIPPTRAVWIPPMVEHEIYMSGEVLMRSLFIAAEHCPPGLNNCCVLAVTPLLRELIVRATQSAEHAANPLIQQLMLDSLHLSGLNKVRLDLCHSGVLRALLELEPAAAALGESLYAALAAKDVPRLNELTAKLGDVTRDALRALPSLYGDASVLEDARARLPNLPAISRALDDLAFLAHQANGAELMIDLADLRGYAYHSGVMFSAYVDGVPNAVARGGRYDDVGLAYGRARPATGFSLDLREVARISPIDARGSAVLAPWNHDEPLRAAVAQLRDAGEVVIQALPGHDHDLDEFAFDRVLVERDGKWVVEARS